MEDERRRQILDAVEECVISYGLGGTTLERIADEAGMTRSNLAHFVGNRDEIMDAARQHSVTRFIEGMWARVADLAPPERLERFVERTLADHPQVPRSTALVNALFATAGHDEHAREILAPAIRRVEDLFQTMVEARYPDADPDLRTAVAVSLPLLLREHDRTRALGGTGRGEALADDVATVIDLLLRTLEVSRSDP